MGLLLLLLLLAATTGKRRLYVLLRLCRGSLQYVVSLPVGKGAGAYEVLACIAVVGPVRNMETPFLNLQEMCSMDCYEGLAELPPIENLMGHAQKHIQTQKKAGT